MGRDPPPDRRYMYSPLRPTGTYDHRSQRTEDPVRSPELKLRTGGLVVRWVTTCEYPLLYVLPFARPPPPPRRPRASAACLLARLPFGPPMSGRQVLTGVTRTRTSPPEPVGGEPVEVATRSSADGAQAYGGSLLTRRGSDSPDWPRRRPRASAACYTATVELTVVRRRPAAASRTVCPRDQGLPGTKASAESSPGGGPDARLGRCAPALGRHTIKHRAASPQGGGRDRRSYGEVLNKSGRRGLTLSSS